MNISQKHQTLYPMNVYDQARNYTIEITRLKRLKSTYKSSRAEQVLKEQITTKINTLTTKRSLLYDKIRAMEQLQFAFGG